MAAAQEATAAGLSELKAKAALPPANADRAGLRFWFG